MWRIGLAVVLILSLTLAPLAAEGRSARKVWRIGFMSPYTTEYDTSRLAGLKQGLRDLGYVEGQNIVIEQRHVDGRMERYLAPVERVDFERLYRKTAETLVDEWLSHVRALPLNDVARVYFIQMKRLRGRSPVSQLDVE